MTFSVGQAAPTSNELLMQALGQGASQGISKQIESFQRRKAYENAGLPGGLADLDPNVAAQMIKQQQKNALIQQILGQGEEAQNRQEDRGSAQLSLASDQNPLEPKRIEPKSISPGSSRARTTPQQREALSLVDPNYSRAAQKEEQFRRQEEMPIKERNLKLFDESSSNLKSIDDADIAFTQLKNLSEKISKKEGQSFFERLGRTYRFDPDTGSFSKIGKATSTPEEERFIKLIADQTKNIKNDYGARITNLDMEVFLRRFPDLMMSPQGRRDILDTLDDYNQAKKLYNRAVKSTISENKGMIDPYELDIIVENKIEKPLENIRKRVAERGLSTSENDVSSQFQEGDTASNKDGQTIVYKGGKWQPLQ